MFGGKLGLRLRTPSDQTLPLWREPAGPSQRLRGSIAPGTPKRPQPSPPAALNRPAAELPDQDWPRPARIAPPRLCCPSRHQGCGTGGANIARPQLILIQDQAQIVRSAFARWWQGDVPGLRGSFSSRHFICATIQRRATVQRRVGVAYHVVERNAV
jgi:hypothetical protein